MADKGKGTGGTIAFKGVTTARKFVGGEQVEPAPVATPKQWVTVRYDENGLRATVAASNGYGTGGRSATDTVDVDQADELLDELQGVLDKIAKKYGPTATMRAQIAAARHMIRDSELGDKGE